MIRSQVVGIAGGAILSMLLLAGCGPDALDEARRAGRTVESFPAAGEDYFHDMDDAVVLAPEEIRGRNTWLVWTGGNDRFWDRLTIESFGNFDLLKILSSHPSQTKYGRRNRWQYLGLLNEPCFEPPAGPDPKRFNLWLDTRRSDCPPDPFEDERKYPGVAIGARGKTVPVGSSYGWASGIVGLRLFPNPDFDAAAAARWNAEAYYTNPGYYNDAKLVRPYRVGMSCAFCHVGPNPTKPPADAEHPQWANLSSNVGAQYFWVDRIFVWNADESSYLYQQLHTARPGTLDTSLVSTDYINNPRTMNAVYQLGPRLELARRWGQETLAGGGLGNAQINDYVKDGPLTRFFEKPSTVWTPHVLKDGSDSAGALAALNRVYLNIGLYSEEWLRHFKALSGGKPITPIEIRVARKNSVYWQATERQTLDMARFFLKASNPHLLKDAPGGAQYQTKDQAQLQRGRLVFAERCARCHSSKLPPPPVPGLDPAGCAGPGYLDCWNRYWEWTKTDEFKQKMRDIVLAPDFLTDNILSNDVRVPVTLLETNACSPLASNAIAGNIWDNFSSQSYKDLPSVGTITVHHPITGEERQYQMPKGGRGYTRPASLVSVWSTAPFLLNNSVGKFEEQPSVEARMRSFQASIEELLWPERRRKDKVLGDKIPGYIDRTSTLSSIRIPGGYLPDPVRALLHPLHRIAPWIFGTDEINVEIPAGTPINLIANLELVPDGAGWWERFRHGGKILRLVPRINADLKHAHGAPDAEARARFANLVEDLLKLSKCPDFVVNRGHYFGTSRFKEEPGLSDEDKYALIEFLKTF